MNRFSGDRKEWAEVFAQKCVSRPAVCRGSFVEDMGDVVV